jgi:hypothetical protein
MLCGRDLSTSSIACRTLIPDPLPAGEEEDFPVSDVVICDENEEESSATAETPSLVVFFV